MSVDEKHVNDLLKASMFEHLAWRANKSATSLGLAADARLEAHALDPGHTASGWAEEQSKTPKGRDTHEELTKFYAEKLK